MGKDLFLIDTGCDLTSAIESALRMKGYGVETVYGHKTVEDDVLRKASGYKAICIFVNMKILPSQVEILKENGNSFVICCSAGYDNVPIELCHAAGIRVARVPSYSPSSIAEYAIACIFCLARHIQKSFARTNVADFRINGLLGMHLEDKTVGILGTGMIGKQTAEKVCGLVKAVKCYDPYPANDWIKTLGSKVQYVTLHELYASCHIISIHLPLIEDTRNMINKEVIGQMVDGVVIVNTSRGGVIATCDLIDALKSGKVSAAALDTFQDEKEFIFHSHKESGFKGFPLLEQLSAMDNVIISSHVAFYTDESIRQITEQTLSNFECLCNNNIEDKYLV